MLVLGNVFVFISIYLQLYYWCGWTKMQNKKKISAICKVIIIRTLAVISCIIAFAIGEQSSSNIFYVTFLIAFILLLYDVFRLKTQIDETIK